MAYDYDCTPQSKVAAAPGSLRAAKLAWATQIANAMADRFKNYGGWRNFNVETKVSEEVSTYVTLEVRSDSHGWTGHASIYVDENPMIQAWINVDAHAPKDMEDVDLFELLQKADDETMKVKIDDQSRPDKLVSDVSLWFSKQLDLAKIRG